MDQWIRRATLLLIGAPALLLTEAAEAQHSSTPRACSMDSMPEADKKRMIAEYGRRQRTEGKAKADAWAMEQGHAFRRKLVAEGVCAPLPAGAEHKASAARATSNNRKAPLNKNGRPCSKIRMENRATPNFGGAPMTMSLVPVCAD